ncbi:riboflavin synthase [Rhizobiaceae bacterium]|nr:riboflavin synthase [Rhizobiaceae bacterium]
MFTGIITAIGTVGRVEPMDQGKRFRIASSYDSDGIALGASIAHDGVCLTVTDKGEGWYDVEAWEEALRLTTAGSWHVDTRLNLERALKIGDELGGHIVSGHIDGMATVERIAEEGEAARYTLRAPHALAKFIAPKGSIALNGTSLTVNGVDGAAFDVLLIRHSREVTTWGALREGDAVNLEVDTMARYAARLASFDPA